MPAPSADTHTCTSMIPGGNRNELGTSDVVAVLDVPEMQAVLDAGSLTYGRSSVPTDGLDFVIESDGARIQVGAPCSEQEADCAAIPPVLDEAEELLVALTEQQLAAPGCPP